MCIRDSLLSGMKLVQSTSSFVKSNALSSVVRNASCSRGWLRLLVQSIFAAVTVASFVLIVLMAIPTWPPRQPIHHGSSRCRLNSCRIECRETPFFGDYEDEIINAVSIAEENNCENIFLTLYDPMFVNNTMPPKWLSSLRTNIHALTIHNGNLMNIPPDAFMSQYTRSISQLSFQSLRISTWTPDSFVGLSSLRHFFIKDCIIVTVPRDALKAVDYTLESLTITRSEHWNPSSITGSTQFMKLTIVDFSSNYFESILERTSFTGLRKCKILYLNSCRISAIGAGTFDNLHSIEMIYLHNNYLVTLPAGLFGNIMSHENPRPRINLQDNLWHCDCSAKDIRELIAKDMLVTDAVCQSPEYFKYKSFTELESHCNTKNASNLEKVDLNPTEPCDKLMNRSEDISGFVYVSNGCYNGNESSSNSSFKFISPVYGHECPKRYFGLQEINRVASFAELSDQHLILKNGWIKFTYFLKTLSYSMVQIGALESTNNYGIVWYQSTCPNELYCVNDVPAILRIYNIDLEAHYFFCPIMLSSGTIESDTCLHYHHPTFEIEDAYNNLQILLYIATGMICLVCGAICVYALIRKHPHLLKGSKRILFVKHKTVDALVLPPKVPLRNDLVNESAPNCNEKKIFIVPTNNFFPGKFNRNKSTRSSKSNTPSYISALQPTEDQLAEWRIRHHFNNDLSITSSKSELSTFSWIYNDDALYYSLDIDNDRTYESLK